MNGKTFAQGQEYLVELGPATVPAVVPRLQDPEPGLREALVDVLGVIGDETTVATLEPVDEGPRRVGRGGGEARDRTLAAASLERLSALP